MRSRILHMGVVSMIVAVTAGCGGSDGQAVPQAAVTTASSTTTVGTSPVSSPTTAAPKIDAKAVADALVAAKLPLTKIVVQTEDNDPNNLLGRPNGYLSRVSFDVPGGDPQADQGQVDRGGAIEIFADPAGATARKEYIQNSLKADPMLGTEYDYVNGPVLVRITGKVKPSVAKPFEMSVAALKP